MLPDPRNTLYVGNSDFYEGFRQATVDFEQKYKPKVEIFDDAWAAMIFARIVYGTDHSDHWKMGYLGGLFTALFGYAYMWRFERIENSVSWLVEDLLRERETRRAAL